VRRFHKVECFPWVDVTDRYILVYSYAVQWSHLYIV